MATNITITSDDVVAIAPELDGTDGALFDLAITFANMEISLASWGDQERANRAARYLVAHLVTQMKPDDDGQSVMSANEPDLQSETVGGVTRTYVKSTTSAVSGSAVLAAMSGLGDTAYGAEYLRQLKIRAVAHRVQVL